MRLDILLSRRFPVISKIDIKFDSKAILSKTARLAVNQECIYEDLLLSQKCYSGTLPPINRLESKYLNLQEGYKEIKKLQFYEGPVSIRECLIKRLN